MLHIKKVSVESIPRFLQLLEHTMAPQCANFETAMRDIEDFK